MGTRSPIPWQARPAGLHQLSMMILFLIVFITLSAQHIAAIGDSFYFEIKENTDPNVYVGKIAIKSGFTYRFTDEPAEFKLDPLSGVITTGDANLDRETQEVYNLVILSSSPTYPIEIRIKVLDENDNAPIWPSIISNVSFSESAPVGTKVIIENAIDLDTGQLRYTIDYVNDAANISLLPFKLNYNSSTTFLHLEVSAKLDRELQSNYLVNVTAIDEGQLSSSEIFNIHILDSNDNPPIFDHSDYSVSLNESMPKDVSILQVHATDADEEGNDNSRISYYLDSKVSDDFAIDQSTGVISTTHDGTIFCGKVSEKSTDEKICVFTVFAHDYGVPRQSGRTYVTAKIYDSNNHAPTIKFRGFFKSHNLATIDESAAPGHVVAAVSVVDVDQGRNGITSVELINGNELGHFRLDSFGNSHTIKINSFLDREKVSRYNLTVLAFDHGNPRKSSTASLNILVQVPNDHAPVFEQRIYEAAIAETESQIGVFVIALKATDSDEGITSRVYYTLSGDNSHYFRIDSTSGLVTTDKAINREEIDFFELLVKARDGGSNPKWAQATLRVKILDRNDEVPMIRLPSKYVFNNKTAQYDAELQDDNFLELDLSVKDNDLGDNGTVDVQILYNYDNLFRIEPETTRLVSTTPLSSNGCDAYTLVLHAKDRGPVGHQLSSLTTIKVNVKGGERESPVLYPRQYFASIDPSSLNHSTAIVQLKVNDAVSAATFAIRSQDDLVNQLFYVSERGVVRLTNNANRRLLQSVSSPKLTFEVECLDCKQDEDKGQVTLFVSDYHSEPFGHQMKNYYQFKTPENAAVGQTVGHLDVDIDQYYLIELVGGDLKSHFRLSGNGIYTNKPLDREKKDRYRLQVIATAKSGYLMSITVDIEVLDVNDCQPHFSVPFDRVIIDQHVPAMFVVRRLDAIDPDLGSNGTSIEYSLIENAHDLFVIDGSELKLSKTIRAATRHTKQLISAILRVKIRATDKEALTNSVAFSDDNARCHLSNELTLFISINSTHSKARFMKSFYEFVISESTPINEQVFRLATRHIYRDSVNLAIVSGNVNNSFGILPSGFLYIRNQLDRENVDLYLLTVQLHETRFPGRNASSSSIDTCQVRIRVLDINDNKPVFHQSSYQFAVPENAPKNFLIGRVTATDQDIGANSLVTYSVLKAYYSSFVQIDSDTGYLWTSHEYDRESLASFEITVFANDQPIDEDKFSSQVTVRIVIKDMNDNPPVFQMPTNVSLISTVQDSALSGKLSVSEDTEVGSTLAYFRASDADTDSVIVYRLDDKENSTLFQLTSSGALILIGALDRELKDSYQLSIEASDGLHVSCFDLQILLEDINDCQPEWVNLTQTELEIPENISIGSGIMHFDAVDPDLGQNALFHFSIENYTGSQKYFDILENKLVVVNPLDYEKLKTHILNVSLVESHTGRIASTKTIRINLEDINDCTPVFVQRADTEVVRVPENIGQGSKLLTLQAVDCDQNDHLTYNIVSCNTHYHTRKNIYQNDNEVHHKNETNTNNCPLKLSNNEIITYNNLDRESIESINLQLSVTDRAGHTDRMKVIFLIEDINDESPMFVSPKKILVTREMISRPNTVLGRVKAIDLDMGIMSSAITYRLQSAKYEPFIEVDRFGIVRVKSSLEPLMDDLLFNVSAVDGDGLSQTDTVQLIVRPDLPFLETEHIQFALSENTPPATQIRQLKCQQFDSCKFHLINATDRNFQVDTLTGHISTVDTLDREMLETRRLEVLVVSKANLQFIQITINLLDENDNPPYFTNTSIVVHLKESAPVGTEVFDFSRVIADEDINNKFTYTLSFCSNNCESTFALDKRTGILILKASLDSETCDKYQIRFFVRDGIYELSAVMEVIVDDENDNKPYFNQSSYVFWVEENTERGVVVGQLTATDADVSSNNLAYSLLFDPIEVDALLGAFSLDSRTGQFTLSRRLNYETDPRQYVFHVEANDGKYTSSPVKVVFKLINLPDNEPIFENTIYKLDVMENTVAQNVICVTATDADLKDVEEHNAIDSFTESSAKPQLPLKYYIEGTSLLDSFHIDIASGCISIVKPLDREQLSRLNLTVIADDGYVNATAMVDVKVGDDNDNYPIFDKLTPSILRVEENVPLDAIIYTFKAVDLDEPPNSYIKYELIYNQTIDSKLPFIIGTIDGQLKVTSHINRELVDHFDVIIRANDYGFKFSDFACRIEIDDVIDNSPAFSKPNFEISLYENISIGEIAFKLDAKDADQTDEINYKIISGNSLGNFRIEDDTLLTASKLNFEEISIYNLKINAIDKAGNLDTMSLKVNVLNVMDERPVFLDSPYLVNWFENRVGVLDQFEAYPSSFAALHEEPLPYYGFINYVLMSNYENSFWLNSSSGVMGAIKPFDRETLIALNLDTTIELKLIAFDTRSGLSSEGVVYVTIVDDNDNEPTFERSSYSFSLNENQLLDINSTVGVVQATDRDETDVLLYKLEESVELFGIDSNGRIFVTSPITFDRESRNEYLMKVKVTDSRHIVTVPVSIVINDLNDCTPRLTKINNLALSKKSNKMNLSVSYPQLKSMVEKKFPIVGFQIIDGDSGLNAQVQFRMDNGELYNTFTIDQSQGLINYNFKNIDLLKETLSKSSVDVTVADMSILNPLFSNYSIQMEVTNANTHRERVLLKDRIELFVREGTAVNQSIHKFEVLHSISEINIYAGDVYGHFAVSEHNLILTRPIDFEMSKSFDLYLLATNQLKDLTEFHYVFVRINVQNENDNPPRFLHDVYNASVLEEEEETFVTQVVATDLDSPSSRITYKILEDEKVPFRIEAETGNIWTTTKIDRETNSLFRLTIAAADEGGLASTCTVLIMIEDKNDNPPKFTNLFRVNITENIVIGSFVIQVTSSDRDEKSKWNVTYELLTKTDSFKIDRSTGIVYVAGHLDREKRSDYLLLVSANDGSWKTQTSLAINILDENDITPHFERPNYRFDALISSNESIGQVRAIDSDEGENGLVIYRLKSKSKYFTVDSHTGEIILKRHPRVYENLEMSFLNQHFLTIVASDKGLVPRSCEVSVLVRYLPSHSSTPQSNGISLVIPFDLADHTLLYTSNSMISLIEKDQDILATHYNQLFFCGQTKVQPNKSYHFHLNNSFSTIAVNLSITEANFHSPVFVSIDQNSTTLEEGVFRPRLVKQFTAVDKDESNFNNVVHYYFNMSSFHWNPNASNYLFLNYRDKYPQLFKKNLTLSEIVSSIGEVASALNPFSINDTNGELQLVDTFDYELITRYSLLISASDNGWYPKVTSLVFNVLVGDIDDFVDNYPKSLRTDSRPDPMSIGVILVIIFFVILIIVISTSFVFYHNQKKNQLRGMPLPQRKFFLNSFSPYLSSNHLPNQAAATRTSRLPNRSQVHMSSQASGQVPRPQPPTVFNVAPSPSQQTMHVPQNLVPINSLHKSHYRPELPLMQDRGHQSRSNSYLPTMKRSDIATPKGLASTNSVTNGSESASMVASRIQLQNGPSSIYTHTNSENYTDNYSNILASAEHYDLENASSIAPSDIDIVYHYKGYRNRDMLSGPQKHAPLSRLSPSVSELSSAPRILTLHDLSPQVPAPCPPIMSRSHMRKQVNSMGTMSALAPDHDAPVTENSFNCSEFEENYDLCKKDKNVFQPVWQ